MAGKREIGGRSAKAARIRRRRRKNQMKVLLFMVAAALLIMVLTDRQSLSGLPGLPGIISGILSEDGKDGLSDLAEERVAGIQGIRVDIQEELQELLTRNEEAADFVNDFANRQKFLDQPIDLSDDCKEGQVPLLMQWDKRWGYDAYGDSIIGLAGCGPTCLTMAYLYFTGDEDENPRTMARFADEEGYHTTEGTSWSLWTEGVEELGLKGEELPLDESRMKSVLDRGAVIVCSMRPGDFTTTGHYIVIRGYDENGFYVNDPNRRSNSEKQWEYGELSGQIKNLWGIWG